MYNIIVSFRSNYYVLLPSIEYVCMHVSKTFFDIKSYKLISLY